MDNNEITTGKSSAQIDKPEGYEKNILANLLTKCGDCKIRHSCRFHKDKLSIIQQKIDEKKTKLEAKKKATPNNVEVYQEINKELRNYAKELRAKFDTEVEDIECYYEKTDVTEDIFALQDKYDFTDARVQIIVKQYIKMAIVDFRAFRDTARKSLTTYKYTEDGSKIPIMNPMASYKIQSGKFILDLITALDKITKEDKMMNSFLTSGEGLFTNFLSKIEAKEIIDVTPEEVKPIPSEVITQKSVK